MGWQDDALVTGKPKWESDPIVSVAPSGPPATQVQSTIDIMAGVAVPTFFAPSANPFSAGRYPLGRTYTAGDEATFIQLDVLTGVKERTSKRIVTRVDYDDDRVEINNGKIITDLMGNMIKNGSAEFDAPLQWVPVELQVGKKWTAIYRKTSHGVVWIGYYDMHIADRESISVPAGKFDSFRVEGDGWDKSGLQIEVRLWLVPGLVFSIKSEQIWRNKHGRFVRTDRYELVSLHQHAIGTKCEAPSSELHRNLVIKSNCA